MSYFFKQKLDLTELVDTDSTPKIVLIAETEEYLSEIYSNYLKSHNFSVVKCKSVDAITKAAAMQNPHLLLLNIQLTPDYYHLFYLLNSLRKICPALKVLTIGDGVESEMIKKLMSMGVSSHIEKRLTRPQDVILIAESILEY